MPNPGIDFVSSPAAIATAIVTTVEQPIPTSKIVEYRQHHPDLSAADVAAHFSIPVSRVKNALRKAPKLSESEKQKLDNDRKCDMLKEKLLDSKIDNILARFGDDLECFAANVFGREAVKEAVKTAVKESFNDSSKKEETVVSNKVETAAESMSYTVQPLPGKGFGCVTSYSTPCYTVQPLPGKGFGCIASRQILPGEIVIEEVPIVDCTEMEVGIARTIKGDMSIDSHKLMVEKLEKMILEDSKRDENNTSLKSQIYSLADKNVPDDDAEKKSLFGILQTNCVGITDSRIGLHIKLSRFNHSCSGNLVMEQGCDENHCESMEAKEYHGKTRLKATRVIEKGEELCFAYITLMKDRAVRIKELEKKYNFPCDCLGCNPKPVVHPPHVQLLLTDPAFRNESLDSVEQNDQCLLCTEGRGSLSSVPEKNIENIKSVDENLLSTLIDTSNNRRFVLQESCNKPKSNGSTGIDLARIFSIFEAENWFQPQLLTKTFQSGFLNLFSGSDFLQNPTVRETLQSRRVESDSSIKTSGQENYSIVKEKKRLDKILQNLKERYGIAMNVMNTTDSIKNADTTDTIKPREYAKKSAMFVLLFNAVFYAQIAFGPYATFTKELVNFLNVLEKSVVGNKGSKDGSKGSKVGKEVGKGKRV